VLRHPSVPTRSKGYRAYITPKEFAFLQTPKLEGIIYGILVQCVHQFEPETSLALQRPYGSTEMDRFRQRSAKIERLF